MQGRANHHIVNATGMVGLLCILSACTQPTLKPICPQIAPWSAAFQQQAAAEIRANPALVALPEIARQDVVLRDQVRACQSGAHSQASNKP
ncbi:hypothetical protein AcetOrient_orf04489 [Acetobacter orientalis]|uniref:Uncharacterized protein n=1 Tax=Acetobacter orientalis TaxID=146474 RepID=A0A2Z5ZLL6_9PROT|nr:hypothetical protein AcetOrient_orf04489 [Acetobacter orientalis]